ncbi:hypothetical protein [Maricaulis sp.]|uniref:hypothetical protein n=1 Tax=Maricaulis sp. TaxID=1486257 RepID=UPI003A8F21A7
MSISYFGHSALDLTQTRRRLEHLRQTRPDWFSGPLELTDARPLGPFGAEIAREFGVEAQCIFGLHLRDKTQIAALEPALDFIYEVFGTDHVVMSWEMDRVRSAAAPTPGLDLD